MASIVQLKRSALSGKVPDTGSLNLGELAVRIGITVSTPIKIWFWTQLDILDGI